MTFVNLPNPNPKENMKIKILKYGAVLFIGLIAGSALASGEKTTAQNASVAKPSVAKPETITSIKEVVKEVPGPERIVEKVVTKEVVVEKTPQICITALDHASTGFSIAGEFANATSEGFNAAAEMDIAGLNAASRKIKASNADLNRLQPKLTAAAQACRAKA